MLRSSRITEAKKSSVSFCMAARSGSSKAGNWPLSGLTVLRLRSWSHWPAKFSTRARALGSRSIRRTCLLEDVLGSWSLPSSGELEELVVGHAAPEEVREPRGELEVVERDRRMASWLGLVRRGFRRPRLSSTRKRNWGETRAACTASWIPRSKRSPFSRARSTNRSSLATSPPVTGRR